MPQAVATGQKRVEGEAEPAPVAAVDLEAIPETEVAEAQQATPTRAAAAASNQGTLRWLTSFKSKGSASTASLASTSGMVTGGSSSSLSMPPRAPERTRSVQEAWVYPGRKPDEEVLAVDEANIDAGENEEGADSRIALFTRSKVVCIGVDHPDSLCEPRAVRDTMPEPLDADDDIRIPSFLVEEGRLSSPQLESISLASRRFRRNLPSGEKCGFLLGDGTGCGKGRCIAALILDQWNRGGRRHVWISATSDLHADAERDLTDIKSGIRTCALAKVKSYGKLDDLKTNKEMNKLGRERDGVLFLTYSMLVSAAGRSEADILDPSKSRFAQVFHWLSHHNKDGHGVICFDEAHRAKNIDNNTKVGRLVLQLQHLLSNCAVVYASATGATEVQHMQYMARLGLWGSSDAQEDAAGSILQKKGAVQAVSFKNFSSFRGVVEKGGVAAMELVAVQLKSMGAMSCRSLAFQGTTFDLLKVSLSETLRQKYDDSVQLWADLRVFVDTLEEKGILGGDKTGRRHGSAYWAAQQRFFKGLIIASKVKKAVELAKEAVNNGEAVVMSLWSTNEAVIAKATKQAKGDGPEDEGCESFMSGPELTFEQYLDNNIGVSLHEYGSGPRAAGAGAQRGLDWAFSTLESLRTRIKKLQLPANPLDDLIDELGGEDAVAEMSGRSFRMVRDKKTGQIQKRSRLAQARKEQGGNIDSINNVENRAFQKGQKLFAIITEAASAGISLHADRRELNPPIYSPRKRRMLCLELPWAADKAVQQLGRVHRSNQLHAPSFVCIVTDLGGEARFVSAVTQRLRQLGAMTRGDRHAALGEDDAFKFGALDVMNGSYGRRGLLKLFNEVITRTRSKADDDQAKKEQSRYDAEEKGLVWFEEDGKPTGEYQLPPNWYEFADRALTELGRQDLKLEEREVMKDNGMKKFLNRLLGCTCTVQVGLFAALALHMTRLAEADRRDGLLDQGVMSLNAGPRYGRLRKVTEVRSDILCSEVPELKTCELQLERGHSFEEAMQLYEARLQNQLENFAPEATAAQGFYIRHIERSTKPEVVLLLLRRRDQPASAAGAMFIVYFPHASQTGVLEGAALSLLRLRQFEIDRKLEAVEHSSEVVREAWRRQYNQSTTQCLHIQRGLRCNQAGKCEIGRRCMQEHMLTGPLLAHWSVIKGLADIKMNLVRAAVTGDKVLVGILISRKQITELRESVKNARMWEEEEHRRAEKELERYDSIKLDKLMPKNRSRQNRPPRGPVMQPRQQLERVTSATTVASDSSSSDSEDLFSAFDTPAARSAFENRVQKDSGALFQAAEYFQGARPGWSFKNGAFGLGYYKNQQDPASSSTFSPEKAPSPLESRLQQRLDEREAETAPTARQDSGALFEAADRFQGDRPGYHFKLGSFGLGYYKDQQATKQPMRPMSSTQLKRLIGGAGGEGNVLGGVSDDAAKRMRPDATRHGYSSSTTASSSSSAPAAGASAAALAAPSSSVLMVASDSDNDELTFLGGKLVPPKRRKSSRAKVRKSPKLAASPRAALGLQRSPLTPERKRKLLWRQRMQRLKEAQKDKQADKTAPVVDVPASGPPVEPETQGVSTEPQEQQDQQGAPLSLSVNANAVPADPMADMGQRRSSLAQFPSPPKYRNEVWFNSRQ